MTQSFYVEVSKALQDPPHAFGRGNPPSVVLCAQACSTCSAQHVRKHGGSAYTESDEFQDQHLHMWLHVAQAVHDATKFASKRIVGRLVNLFRSLVFQLCWFDP